VVLKHPLMDNGCVFCAVDYSRLYKEKPKIVQSSSVVRFSSVVTRKSVCEEKTWHVKRRLCVCCSYSETYKSVARIRLVKSENT
jgi:hypothetical protein